MVRRPRKQQSWWPSPPPHVPFPSPCYTILHKAMLCFIYPVPSCLPSLPFHTPWYTVVYMTMLCFTLSPSSHHSSLPSLSDPLAILYHAWLCYAKSCLAHTHFPWRIPAQVFADTGILTSLNSSAVKNVSPSFIHVPTC